MSIKNSEVKNLVELLAVRFERIEKQNEMIISLLTAMSQGGVVCDDVLTVEDAMGLLNVCRQTIFNLRKNGELKVVEGKGSMVLFRRSELERYKSGVLAKRLSR